MPNTSNSIPKFYTDLKLSLFFLLFVLLLSVLFVVIYQPLGHLHDDYAYINWIIPLYYGLHFLSAFVIFFLCRLVLFFVNRANPFIIATLIIWIIVEMAVVTLSLSGIASLIDHNPDYDFFSFVPRVFIEIVSVVSVPYIISFLLFVLHGRHADVQRLTDLVEKLSPASPSDDSMNFHDRGGKLAFSTRRTNVLYVEAADNYCNIHYINENKEDTFILHNSMKQLDMSGLYPGLLRCHRGYMVNIDNVKLLRKERDGLVLELSRGLQHIPVSRTYNERVVRFFAGQNEGKKTIPFL